MKLFCKHSRCGTISKKQCFIKLFCKYSCCGTISKSTISSIFFVNIHICLLSVSKSLQQRYIFSCLWHCQQLPVCFKMSQSVPICLKMSQNQLNFSQNSFWDILSNFERIFGAGMRHFETFWIDFEQFWAILSGFLGQVWDILSWFWAILSNFERFWAEFVRPAICIFEESFQSTCHSCTIGIHKLWRLKLGRNVFAHFILICVLV